MKNTGWVLAIAALFMVAGCKSYPTYFVDRAPMKTGTQLKMDQAYIAPNAAAALTSRTLFVEVADMRKTISPEISKVNKKRDLPKLRVGMEEVIADLMWRTRVFSDVSVTSDIVPLKNPDLRLEAAVTGWDEGSGLARFLMGIVSTPLRAVGTGPTRIQWEGRIIDTRTGAIVLQWADARIHPGGPSLFVSFRPFRSEVLIQEDLLVSIGIFADGIREVCGVTEPMMSRAEMHPRYHKPKEAAPEPGVPRTTP